MALRLHEWPVLNAIRIAVEHLETRLFAITGESDRETFRPQRNVRQGNVGKPMRKGRVNPKSLVRCVLFNTQNSRQQRESRPGGPCLRDIGAEILNGKR